MRRQHWTGLAATALVGLSCMLSVQAQAPKKSVVQAICTQPEPYFKVGEMATFKVECEVDGEADYRLSEDGFKTVEDGKLALQKGKSVEVSGTLEKPGFLQLRVTLGKEEALAAAAFEPTK